MNIIVTCPICEKESELNISNPYRPFCSERCRLIDLGQWFEETYTIPDSSVIDIDTDQSFSQKH